jgi:cytochrome c5
MYNIPEFNLIKKEDVMSQGSKGSSKFMIVIWVVAMLFIGLKALNGPSNESAHEDTMIDSAALERIKPIGELRIDNSVVVASSSSSVQSERSGKAIYTAKCQSCHTSGVMGAPKYASLEDWAPRINLGIDNLTKSAIAGKGGMPARGACMDCSDNEIKLTVQYMLDSLD